MICILSLSLSLTPYKVRFVCSLSHIFYLFYFFFHTLICFIFSRANKLFFFKGVLEGVLCGCPEWEQFQASLDPTYQLHVISRDFFNTVIYEGPHKSQNKLYVYHAENHYSVITSMPALVERIYYCDNCHMGYNNPGGHVCKQGCACCHAQTACAFEKWVPCPSCRR